MKTGILKNPDLDQVAEKKGKSGRLELLVNNAFDVLGLRRDVKELGRIADFCTAVASSLDADKVLTSAARHFYDFFQFRLLVFSVAKDSCKNSVAFYPGSLENPGDDLLAIADRFPGLKPENIRECSAMEMPSPMGSPMEGFHHNFELPLNAGSVCIVTDANSLENHSPVFMTKILDALAFALTNAVEYGKVKEDSIRDSLTGLYNRRVLEEMLEMEDRKRGVNPLSLLLIDLDNFKAINDTYGHPCGDVALRAAAAALKEKARGSDLVVRNGGEEFAIMLSGAGAAVALEVGERFRKCIEDTMVEYNGSRIRLTASIGIAHRPAKDHFTAGEIMVQADKALYQAKSNGKNKVCFYSSSPVLIGSKNS